MAARRILDVIFDILTLLALAIAGVGHFLPWFTIRGDTLDAGLSPIDFQMWHAAHSGTALGVAALLVGASLVFEFGSRGRKLLVLLMFASVLVSIGFQVMIYTPYPITEAHRQFAECDWSELDGFLVAFVPSIIAGVLCLARMGWTMTAPPNA